MGCGCGRGPEGEDGPAEEQRGPSPQQLGVRQTLRIGVTAATKPPQPPNLALNMLAISRRPTPAKGEGWPAVSKLELGRGLSGPPAW